MPTRLGQTVILALAPGGTTDAPRWGMVDMQRWRAWPFHRNLSVHLGAPGELVEPPDPLPSAAR